LAPDFFGGTMAAKLLSDELKQNSRSQSLRTQRQTQPKLQRARELVGSPQFNYMALSRVDAAFSYLYALPEVQEKVGVVGFGLGGGYVYSLAIRQPRLSCAVSFYGQCGYNASMLSHIACPVMGLYGGADAGLTAQAQRLREAMSSAGVNFRLKIYASAGTGFFNPGNELAYNREAADRSWTECMGFLESHLYVHR
jgi:carboxymethylenebutenolidase